MSNNRALRLRHALPKICSFVSISGNYEIVEAIWKHALWQADAESEKYVAVILARHGAIASEDNLIIHIHNSCDR